MIYQDGVNALLALGGVFAAAMFGWSITEIGLFGIILNVVAIFGCLVASRLDTQLGSKAVVMIALVLPDGRHSRHRLDRARASRCSACCRCPAPIRGGLFGTPAEKAYIVFGLLIGLAFGPVQASSRSYLARSVTADEAGRYFGIYALAGRATSFHGAVPGGDGDRDQRLAAARHGDDPAVPGRRHGRAVAGRPIRRIGRHGAKRQPPEAL